MIIGNFCFQARLIYNNISFNLKLKCFWFSQQNNYFASISLYFTYFRLIDGREAVTFLRKIKTSVEDPRTILLNL